jgi:hypothetical protein
MSRSIKMVIASALLAARFVGVSGAYAEQRTHSTSDIPYVQAGESGDGMMDMQGSMMRGHQPGSGDENGMMGMMGKMSGMNRMMAACSSMMQSQIQPPNSQFTAPSGPPPKQ